MTRAYGSGSSSDSSDSGSSAPGIRLEPPSPEQERRSHNRTFSDMMEVTIQSPSTSSFPRSGYSSPSSSSPSSPRVPRELMNDSPVPISSTRSSELRTVFDSPPVQTVVLPTLPEGRTISEVTPLETPRYNRQKYVPNDPTTFTIPPLCFTFPHSTDGEDPDLRGWEPRTHSEGALYFYHPEKRAFTEAYLYEEVYLDEVEALLAYLQQTLQCMPGIQLPPDYELVAQVAFEDEDGVKAIRWQYYFVDHRTRCLFWLFPLDADIYLTEICGPLSPAHFKHLLESWYWDHVGTFPDNFQTHDDLVDELVGHLTFFSVDVMTSHTSTVPYELSDLTRLIKFMGRKGPGTGAAPRSAALGRMMSIICHWRYIYFHGQRFARLDRFESIHGPAIRPRSWLMSLSSIVFLFAPEAHLLDIEKFYVDNSVARHVWKRHITKLQDEWIEFVLYATVMLTANVSMLSVPDVILFPDNDNAPGAGNNVQSYLAPLRSPAAIASYVSIVCSVGTIVVGLLLIRTHRTKNHDDVNEAVAFMNRLETRLFHYEPLAILYSLPYALLMWAMLSFLISILIFTFRNTDIVTQITVAASSVAVSCLIAWCIVTFWEPSESTLYLRTLRNTFKQRLIRPWASLSEDVFYTPIDMPTAPVDDKETVLFYEDTGPQDGQYLTVVMVHGSGFHHVIFQRMLPYAAQYKVRFITVNRRDYSGSTPYSDEEVSQVLSNDPVEKAKFFHRQALEYAELLAHFARQNVFRPLSVDSVGKMEGGVSLVGWSSGPGFFYFMLSNPETVPEATRTALEPYLRSLCFFDNAPDLVGIENPPDRPYYPFLSDPKLDPMERYVAFATWISGYYAHPGLTTEDENGLSDTPVDDPPPTLPGMPHEILAQISDPKTMLRWETSVNLRPTPWQLERTRRMLHKDTASYWPRCKVVVMWCEQTTWNLVRGAWQFKKLRKGLEEAGEAGRTFEWSSVPKANHFIFWDNPELIARLFSERL
ncbi:unnamed protein product [Peniophora sp. CBMAI 1063]|nr:unnamed protein product [Peniophora sp. CBMAI 1063]